VEIKAMKQGKFNRMPWREGKIVFSFFLIALMHESGVRKNIGNYNESGEN
jgi:hypothetical protein